jgi:hypothetical protein
LQDTQLPQAATQRPGPKLSEGFRSRRAGFRGAGSAADDQVLGRVEGGFALCAREVEHRVEEERALPGSSELLTRRIAPFGGAK